LSASGWERVGAFSGFLFVALYFAAFFGLQDLDFPPAGSASAAQIRSFVEREQFRMALATVSFAAAWSAFLVFVGSIRLPGSVPDSLRRLEWIAASAGLLVAGLSLAGVGLQAEVMFADTTTDEATIVSQWALFDASGGLPGITPFLRAVFVAAVSGVLVREPAPWRWIGWFGLAVAAVNVLGGIDFVVPADLSLTGHPLLDLLAFLGWILAASAVLLVKPRELSEA